ncbi:MAG: 4-hydroxythreonine-4-phosphate dehydrogenase PdxA [Scytolyngbya sp. HA4215-MV1]|nr:4-hydroxythreonine-4-phosphate dehydrogenase PdxA [Scytolyngbya sp. HA4215-MV1]
MGKLLATLARSGAQPRLLVTIGDPAGIGAEVVLKALADPAIASLCQVTVVGNRSLLQATYEQLRQVNATVPLADPAQLTMLEIELGVESQIVVGQENAASGAVSFAYLDAAITACLQGKFQGIVTAPIAKSAWKAAGHPYPGQTELLAERATVERFGMLFVARSPHTHWTLRTLLATTHIPLHQVAETLTPALLTAKLDLLVDCLHQDFGISAPHIAIAGLNPHSGEQGQLGREEVDWLIPWVQATRDRLPAVQLEGPIPPDTLWVKPGQAWYGLPPLATQNPKSRIQNSADAYLALYHDQGLIPVKLMAFDRAVNTTIGLPFIRTSPDHGTAFDIAGKNLADATSMKAALQLATELAQQKQIICDTIVH